MELSGNWALASGIKAETLKLGRKGAQPFQILHVWRFLGVLEESSGFQQEPVVPRATCTGQGWSTGGPGGAKGGRGGEPALERLNSSALIPFSACAHLIPARVMFLPFTELLYFHTDEDTTPSQEKKNFLQAIKISISLPCFNLSCIKRKPLFLQSCLNIFMPLEPAVLLM